MVIKNISKLKNIYSHTGLRGLAAMCVFIAHIYFWNDELWSLNRNHFEFFFCHDYAVDLFFILSGFILNWVYVNESDPIQWKSYLQARIARIMPLYYLTTLIFLLIPFSYLHKYIDPDLWKNYVSVVTVNLLMLSGVLDGWRATLNGVAWSISVEFFCYLTVFPALYLFWKRVCNVKLIIILLILISCILTRFIIIIYRLDPLQIFGIKWDYSWVTRGICGFSIGFFLCCIAKKSKWIPNARLCNFILSFSLVIFILSRTGFLPPHLILYLLPLVVYFTSFDLGFLSEVLKVSGFQWLGDRSYSIYLWHFPCSKIFSLITSLAAKNISLKINNIWIVECSLLILLVLLVSDLSYRFFEVPCRNYIRIRFK